MKIVIYNILLPLCLLLFIQKQAVAQVDQHIDPSSDIHKHSLTFARHINSPFSDTKAKNAFTYSNSILRTCDSRVKAD